MRLPVYLDGHATTPTDPRVVSAMLPFLTEHFGNASSRGHAYGWAADAAVERARSQVATLIGATPREIVFTSGATEACNLALLGVAEACADQGRHFVSSPLEHKAVLDTLAVLERRGARVTWLPVAPDGVVRVADVEAALRPDTVLVSVMAANNEIGTVNPVAELGALCKARGVYFHTDATQAAGSLPLDVQAMGIDLLSLSAHKMYGPKGVGALYVRRRDPRVRLTAQLHGGGHERGLRSGTLPVHQLAGFGAAAALVTELREAEVLRIAALRDRLLGRIVESRCGAVVNGDLERRLPGNLNVSFPGLESDALLSALRDLALSSGAACASESLEPSHVLRALGVDPAVAHSALRFGLGRFTTDEEIDFAADRVVEAVARLRALHLTLPVPRPSAEKEHFA